MSEAPSGDCDALHVHPPDGGYGTNSCSNGSRRVGASSFAPDGGPNAAPKISDRRAAGASRPVIRLQRALWISACASPSANPAGKGREGMLEVNLTPHGAGARLRKPAFAALTIAAATGSTTAAAQAPAPPAAPPAMKASMTNHALVGSKLRVKGVLSAPGGSPITIQRAKGHRWHTVAHTKTGARGRFATSFRARSLGGVKVRI